MALVAVVGAGAWGTALAYHLGAHGVPVRLWVRRAERAKQLAITRENELLLGVRLPVGVEVSHDLERVVAAASTVVFATPCDTLRAIAELVRPLISPEAIVVSAAKGIENGTLLLTTHVLPFWIASVLLTVGLIGAIVIAREE